MVLWRTTQIHLKHAEFAITIMIIIVHGILLFKLTKIQIIKNHESHDEYFHRSIWTK